MSLTSFIKTLLKHISQIFNQLPGELKEAAKTAVTVTQAIKCFDDKNPEVADIITTIIPGNADDEIVKWLRLQLPVILSSLRLVSTQKATADTQSVVYSAISTVNQLQGDIKSSFLHNLAVLLAQEAATLRNKEFKWADAVYIVEWYYGQKFKK
ncbi:hypothetical protein [Mucilaginibacter ginkgonis]|uniref:Uncharacterized protein n=1 Tax=Mucilaginibacter ginkgonis TaxID=2682091 RepID=A0A6I4HYJ1_9SPHI|nr:hypothetical protein [Mucilaginibacter ginkgonis]QQL50323.1 hypothetical protein GO620_002390 [Mucilaginibacter ginkgonis]